MMIKESVELHRMQRTFRSVLDAFARPGTLQHIEAAPDDPLRPAALDGVLTSALRLFVDQAVTFGVADSEPDSLSAYVASESHAVCVAVRDADFVVVPARADERTARAAVTEARRGTLLAPEKGATLFMGCARICGEDTVCAGVEPALSVVEVRGPGVREVNRFAVDRIGWVEARRARGDEFPCGIEIVLVDTAGNLVAIPRSSRVECAACAVEGVC